MNLNSSTLSLDTLKGALLTNPNGAEFRIAGFCFHPNEPTKVYVSIQQIPVDSSHCDTLCWASLTDWDIQVQEVA
tara:strand:- start:467 stop:691 length:225 start_codon:yes stop_codon:yes gene_type:complete